MSDERGAWSGKRAAGRSRSVRRAGGFTIIELLVVIAIVAILTALVAPSLQGFFGVAGRRGGVSALSAALEQARLAAVENGTSGFVGFATSASNKDNAFSSIIVFRAKREDETTAAPYVAISRWLRLPTGVYMEPASISSAATSTVSVAGVLPRLGTESISSVPVIEFDRFGRLKDQTKTPVLRLGEGARIDSSVTFRPNGGAQLTVLPLTGRVQISDVSL